MEKIFIKIVAFLWLVVFTKKMLFWLWLWQLKDYHLGRFKAHFETQKFKKIVSSFWRLKYPRFTRKMILLVFFGFLSEVFILALISILSVKATITCGFLGSCEKQIIINEELFFTLLLFFIVLAPVIISLIVLMLQIPTIVLRNRILTKAAKKRGRFKDLIVVGITGSYGKTSTKEFLYTILSQKFNVLKTKEHINAEIGIAQTILNDLKPEHQILIAEIGAYERGKITQVCQMLQPKIGILTGINAQHQAMFGSQENIIKAKFELLEALPNDRGVAIMNGDNGHIMSNVKFQISNRIQNPSLKYIFCSVKEKNDFWTRDIKTEKEKVLLKMGNREGESAVFEINFAGKHNIINLLMAAACAREVGMNLDEIAKASGAIKNPFKIQQNKRGLNIIDSTYSANPDSVVSHLEYLRTAWPESRKILIMPCLIELGEAAKEAHYKIGQKIGKICALAIVTTKENFTDLKRGALDSGMTSDKILFIEDANKVLQKLKASASAGDMLLLESRIPAAIKNELLLALPH